MYTKMFICMLNSDGTIIESNDPTHIDGEDVLVPRQGEYIKLASGFNIRVERIIYDYSSLTNGPFAQRRVYVLCKSAYLDTFDGIGDKELKLPR